MFSKKKTECRVCGYRFTPERENIYTAEEPRSALEMLTTAFYGGYADESADALFGG